MLADHEQVRQANVALVRRFVDAINDSWNIEVIRELVADDLFFIIPSRRIGSGSVTKAKRTCSGSWTALEISWIRRICMMSGSIPAPAILLM